MDFRISSDKVAGASWLNEKEASAQLKLIADLLENLAIGETVSIQRIS
jgi:hypothetical protein